MTRKVLFITGAGSGIGQLMARRALDAGWAVAALDVQQAGLDRLGDAPALLKLVADITDLAAVEAAAQQAEDTLGPIDRLVNAAAIMPLGLLTEQPAGLMHKTMAINYGGLVNVSKAVLPRLIARGRGEFVSFASMAGHWPVMYMGAYDATKHAVVAFTEVLHHETRRSGVRTICVCPPIVATPLLKQAQDSVWPKVFDVFPPITPEQVVDAIDRRLSGHGFWVFPGPMTRLSWYLRRLLPGPMWWFIHRVEGR
jgi:NADP-dependent 3-hydroxy acid dehydrogenase YdfG